MRLSRCLPRLAALVAATPLLLGCGARAGIRSPAQHAERVAPATAEVGDDAFAAAVHDLLVSDPGSRERAVRLGAVEGRQMARAAARFQAHAADRGLAAVSGGLYLVHLGEPSSTLFGTKGSDALRAAARELSARGDEGRARAAYDLFLPLATPTERADVQSHVGAIESWMRDSVAESGPVAADGALEHVAVRRWLLEPTREAQNGAASVTADWISRAVAVRDKFRKTRVQPSREEGTEAWRALETGAVVLASIYLRDGDAAGAMAAIDHAQARELLEAARPPFAQALEAAAQEPGVDRCIDLLHQLRPLAGQGPTRDDEDFSDDRELFAAAAFGVAAECYRLDPTVPEVALTLGAALEELGMAEATPAVLVEAAKAHPGARMQSEALGLSLDAIESEEEAGDADAARRAYRASEPLLATAADQTLAGKVHPSAARVRAAMGGIELREGRIDAARALLTQSVDEEKNGGALLALARIEWRDGQTQGALDHLREALEVTDPSAEPALRGEVLLTISDVTRDKGDVAGARTPLGEALRELVQSRNAPNADSRASIERVLSRVLDRYGATQPAQRALERAYEAAPRDKRQVTQTIELVVGRAFLRGDLPAAREGLQHALEADLDSDDLVYLALWVRLLERQLHAPTDDVPDHVFASVADDGGWVATLARFGEGKIKGDDLIKRATTPIQRYEALFYDAVDHRVAGDTKGGDDLLRQVVTGTGIELSEVRLARDMLDPSKAQLGPLPPDVSIP